MLPDPVATAVCRAFLREVHSHRTDQTVRSYAYDLQRYFRFLSAIDVDWNNAASTEITDFFIWMKQAKKKGGNKRATKRDPRVARNPVTGKPYLDDSFTRASMDHNETVLFLFYEFLRRKGQVLYNPVVRGRTDGKRTNAHHNPLRSYDRGRSGRSRQGKGPKRLPRSIPDEQFDAFFDALGNDRDRALVAMYVSSGARPSEVLNLDVADIDLPDGLITVIRKGGRMQDLPISWDAVAWYRLYQSATGYETSGPAWRTVRGKPGRLSYDALRATFKRANRKNGTNWSPHDLRHTAATRMLAQGTPPRTVQEILGHSSLATLEVYTVPRLDEMIAAVRTKAEPSSSTVTSLLYDDVDMAVLFGQGGDGQ